MKTTDNFSLEKHLYETKCPIKYVIYIYFFDDRLVHNLPKFDITNWIFLYLKQRNLKSVKSVGVTDPDFITGQMDHLRRGYKVLLLIEVC